MLAGPFRSAQVTELGKTPDNAEMKQHGAIAPATETQADVFFRFAFAGSLRTDRGEIEIRHVDLPLLR